MGAYVHRRGLIEIDGHQESYTERESIRYLSETTRSYQTRGSNYNSTGGASPFRFAGREESSLVAHEMDDCSSFWAGQLDDVFEDLRFRGIEKPATGSNGASSSGHSRGLFPGRERRMGSMDRESFGSGSTARGDLDKENFQKLDACTTHSLSEQQAESVGARNLISADVSRRTYGCSSEEDRGGNAQVSDMDSGGGTRVHEVESDALLDENHPDSRGEAGAQLEEAALVLFEELEDETERLPDHLLVEIFIRIPARDWPLAACAKKRWGQLFKGDSLWHSALLKRWPLASFTRRWPGPITRGSSKRRYTALRVSTTLFPKEKMEGIDEVAGHVYLFLKEQLESSTPPASYGLLHGTIIDQFLACSKTGDEAHELASHIWVAVLDKLDESESTFHLLMRIAAEWEVFLPYPYSKSNAVQWRLFERLFTDFRDCLSQYNYFDVLSRAKNRFEMIRPKWLGD